MSRMISYRCDSCGLEHERYVPAEMTHSRCPHCGQIADKVLTVPVVHFKGTGWTIRKEIVADDERD